jgi:hypothetical protein
VKLDDLTPLAKDNSTMADFDAVIIYNINPANAAELYSTKSKSFHLNENGDIFLMYNYVQGLARNAIFRSARKYEALMMNDGREAMQMDIKSIMEESLAVEKLENAITINQVLIRGITPAAAVVASANTLVQAKNQLEEAKIKVEIAKKEAERIQALNSNAGAIQYMDAQGRMLHAEAAVKHAEAAKLQAEGIKEFKGTTLVIGSNANPVVPLK